MPFSVFEAPRGVRTIDPFSGGDKFQVIQQHFSFQYFKRMIFKRPEQVEGMTALRNCSCDIRACKFALLIEIGTLISARFQSSGALNGIT